MRDKLLNLAIMSSLIVGLVFLACAPKESETIKIGINAPLTGDIPKVGESTKFAAQIWLEDVNAAGGQIAGKPVYRSVTEIPGPVDLAVVTIPAAKVPDLIAQFQAKNIRNMPGSYGNFF